MSQGDIHVVVLSHNRPEYLRVALGSLRRQGDVISRITVVDNKSAKSDAIVDVAASFPGVELIRNSENIGFARAMNRGLRVATDEFVFFMCDDIEVERDGLRPLREHLRDHPEVGMCTGAIIQDDRIRVRATGFAVRSGPPLCVEPLRLNQPISALPPGPFAVDGVPGGVAFGRTKLLQRLGGFRESFFMYVEDIELSMRLRSLGYRLDCVPSVHLVDLAAPHSFGAEMSAQALQNTISLYVLHAPLPLLVKSFEVYGARAVVGALLGKRPLGPILDAWRGVASEFPRLLRDRMASGAKHSFGIGVS